MRLLTLQIPAFLACFALVAHAQVVTLNNPTTKSGTTLKDFIMLLIDIMELIAIPMLAMFIIYAGFLVVTAGGNEEQVSRAKMWFLWTLVGGVIVVGAKVLANVIFNTAGSF